MYFLLLIVSFTAATLSLFLRHNACYGSYTALRLAFIKSLILHGASVFVYNEVFSFFNLITPLTARLYWLLVAVATVLWLNRSLRSKITLPELTYQLRHILTLDTIDKRSRFLIYTGLIIIVLPLLILAVYAPPSNYDSHQYHLMRILYWLNDHNLDHFPTVHVQQLYHNVFSEYLVLHTFLLTGSDYLANVIQFGAMLGTVTAVSLLAKRMGLGYRGQLLAGILMLCLPIGLFESTTTQNDYIACFYFVSFVLFGYWFLRYPDRTTLVWCLLALAFGSFTKYPILFFALPFAIYLAVQILRRQGFLFGWGTLVGAILLFAILFAPFFARNYAVFGSIMSPQETSRLSAEKIPVDKFSVAHSVSGVVKNAGLHIGTPYSPYNIKADSVIVGFHRLIGVAVEDPAISKDQFQVRFSMQEDMAPNTVHFFLLLVATLLLFTRRGHSSAKLLFSLSLAGFVLYSSVFKFQLYSSRVHMSFFAIGCVITAYVWQGIFKRSGFYLTLLLYVVSMAVVFGNPSKMVIPIRYIAQRLLAHVPSYVCLPTADQQRTYYQVLNTSYQYSPSPLCLSLRQAYNYGDRAKIFHKLDSLSFFRQSKEESVLYEHRAQAYFTNHPHHYKEYAPLLAYIGPDVKNIGFLPGSDSGFYHYWSALNQQTDHPVEMAYIRYFREYANLPNAQRAFCYNYILSDDAELIRSLIKPADITEIHSSGKLVLVRLKRFSCQTYLF
ncbi:ArnT family glycosyltransferase [Spirosoma sp.]|uniref:ArnT family glycosyltransferase n=1 Tax=Spirosoma sp. TaxID=1899569 RepID=UPI003B39FAF4